MTGRIAELHAPETVDEALAVLARRGRAALVLAGGTDVMVRLRRGAIPDRVTDLVSLHRLAALRGVRREGGEMVVGAATTASDLLRDPLVARHAPILARVADRMASEQIRNRATVGGNLANASPAGDLINPLLLLDARVALASTGRNREVPVEELFVGPGETVASPGELLTEIRFVVPPAERVFRFLKAGTRPAMECALASVGLAFTLVGECLREVRVAIGSCAPTPLRGRSCEAVLEGQRLTPEVVDRAVAAADRDVSPCTDLRASASYRRALVGVFLRRMLDGRDG